MKKIKIILLTAFIALITLPVMAQSAASGNQFVNLHLSNAISVSVNTNTGTIIIPITKATDYVHNVKSVAQQLMIQSNKAFNIAVETRKSIFDNTPVSEDDKAYNSLNNVLELIIDKNGTGGKVASPFNSNNFCKLTGTPQNLISTANNGGNQTFSIIYLANPGLITDAEDYNLSADVIFTTTQL